MIPYLFQMSEVRKNTCTGLHQLPPAAGHLLQSVPWGKTGAWFVQGFICNFHTFSPFVRCQLGVICLRQAFGYSSVFCGQWHCMVKGVRRYSNSPTKRWCLRKKIKKPGVHVFLSRQAHIYTCHDISMFRMSGLETPRFAKQLGRTGLFHKCQCILALALLWASTTDRVLDSACEQRPERHPHGYWMTDMKPELVENYISRQAGKGILGGSSHLTRG